MASNLPSDEVAEDYKGALEDLVTNDRYSIANLTMIAKENIEHAEAISRVLTNHINRVSLSERIADQVQCADRSRCRQLGNCLHCMSSTLWSRILDRLTQSILEEIFIRRLCTHTRKWTAR